MGSTWKKAPQEKVDFFNEVLVNHSEVERRKMFGYPCAFLGGNMFFGLFEDAVFLRLAEEDRSQITAGQMAVQFEPLPGRVMREYVTLSPEIVNDNEIFQNWFKKSLVYAARLPVKVKKGSKK
jgi:TfoX/Sxy family transcriptional regulator of competence genes